MRKSEEDWGVYIHGVGSGIECCMDAEKEGDGDIDPPPTGKPKKP